MADKWGVILTPFAGPGWPGCRRWGRPPGGRREDLVHQSHRSNRKLPSPVAGLKGVPVMCVWKVKTLKKHPVNSWIWYNYSSIGICLAFWWRDLFFLASEGRAKDTQQVQEKASWGCRKSARWWSGRGRSMSSWALPQPSAQTALHGQAEDFQQCCDSVLWDSPQRSPEFKRPRLKSKNGKSWRSKEEICRAACHRFIDCRLLPRAGGDSWLLPRAFTEGVTPSIYLSTFF